MAAPADLIDVAREALLLTLTLCVPLLIAAFAAGLVTAFLQMLSKVSEPALSYAPRIVAVAVVALVAAPWIGSRVARFAESVWSLIQSVPQ